MREIALALANPGTDIAELDLTALETRHLDMDFSDDPRQQLARLREIGQILQEDEQNDDGDPLLGDIWA
jgi:hypothetical protein